MTVDNRPGAGGVPGVTISPQLDSGTPYDPPRDLVPEPIIVSSATPYHTLQELLAAAHAQPGKINQESTGSGSLPHWLGELPKNATGVEMTDVPHSGGQRSQPHYSRTRFRSGLLICQFYCRCFVIGQSSHLRLARQNACHGCAMCRR